MPIVFLPSEEGILSSGTETVTPENVSMSASNTTSDNEDEDEQDSKQDNEGCDRKNNIILGTKSDVVVSQTTLDPQVEKRDRLSLANRAQTQTRAMDPARLNSIQKPSRVKSRWRQSGKENVRIRLITNFSESNTSGSVVKQPALSLEAPCFAPAASGFIDLAALQVLDNHAPKPAGGLWKSFKGLIPGGDSVSDSRDAPDIGKQLDRNPTKIAATPVGRFMSRRGERPKPASMRFEADLSPCDRPIVIGISIPSSKLAQHVASPQTASSDTSRILESYVARSPEEDAAQTSDILISSPQLQSRATSSVYSRTTDLIGKQSSTNMIPLYEALAPERRSTPQSLISTIFAEDEDLLSPQRSRVKSTQTVFEEDESPILSRRSQAISMPVTGKKNKPTSIITTMEHRMSKGWWDAIVTPFLTRSNTFVSPHNTVEQRPALPDPEIVAINSQIDCRDILKWEMSFSPKTPETSTTIVSDAWLDKPKILAEESKPSEFLGNSSSPSCGDEDAGTLPFVLSVENSTIPLQDGDVHADNLLTETPTETRPEINESLQGNATIVPEVLRLPNAGLANGETSPIISHSSDNALSIDPEVQGQQNPRESSVASLQRPQVNNITTQIVINEPPRALIGSQDTSIEEPPPQYSPPRPTFRRYHAVFPPGQTRNSSDPLSPGPTSPGVQQEMLARDGIALNEVRRTSIPQRRPINLNPGYSGFSEREAGLPYTAGELGITSKKSRKAEARRRRYEKEDALAHNIGNLWRGRGCFPRRGCYGRSGAEGRKKRRCYFCLIAGFLTMIILILVLSLTLHRTQSPDVQQSQWLNLTGFPPIYTGISTISAPDNTVANTGCVFPSTMWSCSLPKELQSSVALNQSNEPNFKLQIQWDNSTVANTSFANITSNPTLPVRSFTRNVVQARYFFRKFLLRPRQSDSFSPSPAAPSYAEQFFLGNTTDGIVSDQKAGEPTPFFISFLSTTNTTNIQRRDQPQSNPFPSISSAIPAPDVNNDGTAAPANLLPFPVQQPLRLYDRGLPTEHYGFYTYFNRSIFLKSTSPLNESNIGEGEVPDDTNGGARETEAAVRCTWAETRFLVQMWTRKNTTAELVGSPLSFTSLSANDIANDYTRPGSFPYPVTVTTDRHGGDPTAKLLYCYGLDSRERPTTFKLQQENKSFGGSIINQAPSLFVNNSNPNLGGYDGGSGGCRCQWQNWIYVTNG
jgi:hypothetical protein